MHVPNDIRFRGALMQQHTFNVGRHPEWEKEIDDLEAAALHLLTEAIDSWEDAVPVDLDDLAVDLEDDEDEPGMGMRRGEGE
jgi:hypothetical protein